MDLEFLFGLFTYQAQHLKPPGAGFSATIQVIFLRDMMLWTSHMKSVFIDISVI